jgi:hypothetical protein
MCPRNPCAIIATTLCLCLGLPVVADAGPKVTLSCAVPSGDCSGKKLFGRHIWKRDLTRTKWIGSRLLMASFRFSDLYAANFRNAKARRIDLSYGNRTQANFNGGEFTLGNFSHADFWGSSFRRADMRGTDLTGARFNNVDLTRANFEGSKFIGTSFQDITLCHTIQPNGEERNDNCPGNNGGSGGGKCCFPGGKKKDKGKGNDNSSGSGADDGSQPIVGDL